MNRVSQRDAKRAVVSALIAVACLVGATAPGEAALGGAAVPNDNCTSMNSLQIGIMLPNPAVSGERQTLSPIIDTHLVLAHGWQLVGWLTTTQSGHSQFTPYSGWYRPSSPIGADLIAPIGTYTVPTPDQAGIQVAWEKFRRTEIDTLGPPLSEESPAVLPAIYLAPCFTAPAHFESTFVPVTILP